MRLPIVHALILTAALSLSGPWKRVAPGVETAPAAELGGDPAWSARVVLADPAKARLLVRYDAARPTLTEWRKRFPNAIAIVNGSFYSKDGAEVRPTCDLVSDGLRVPVAGDPAQRGKMVGGTGGRRRRHEPRRRPRSHPLGERRAHRGRHRWPGRRPADRVDCHGQVTKSRIRCKIA